ncbi:hypothetical protein TanjilG_10283 [Lupinus angustifolius]|uniref:Uncharacterized protein n=1 Tax=Lupinus angustifolius TaxID=3871 RepID=A0A394D6T4_LUPAN|nr:hypothetical protein TanjilG_10283 [Lupinus angustifolius]
MTLNNRMKNAEGAFLDCIVEYWFNCREIKGASNLVVGADEKSHMEELVSIILYASRLGRSDLVDIMSATSVYQG